jgi:N-acetylglutamate synthase-like GNAT family acetyltransferase
MTTETSTAELSFADEKQFYLEEFRGRTLMIAVSAPELQAPVALADVLGPVAADLVNAGARVVLLLASDDEAHRRRLSEDLARALPAFAGGPEAPALFPAPGPGSCWPTITGAAGQVGDDFLVRIWLTLRRTPVFVGFVTGITTNQFTLVATDAASRLRVHKLVLVDPEGGIADASGQVLAFMDEAVLATVLSVGQAEWAGLGHRRNTFEAVRNALLQGVGSVNLCRLPELAHELFTYNGAGTLFTLSDYCAVERLGIDDFAEVEKLLARGVREGVLKPRSLEEIARFLLHAYGASVGNHHLAGVCGLEAAPYADQHAGEVVGLYTITRFKGEGIGRKLLARVVADATRLGLRYLFACTTSPQAQAFFEREGFRVVPQSAVPAAKWVDYPPDRREHVVALRRELP